MLVILTVAVVAVSGGILLAQAASKPARGQRLAMAAKLLGLTDQQKAQAKDILQQAKADAAQAATPQEKRQIWQAARDKIKALLTPEQLAKGKALRRHMLMRRISAHLNLTADQKTQARDIFKQARLDAQQAPDKAAKQQIWKAAFEKVKTQVLTDQQRKQLEEMKARRQAKTPATVN
jgi:Spy/CpxP family protein refolding chaperone